LVEEECDETLFWLELISEANLLKKNKLQNTIKEAKELTTIFRATGRTARQKIRNPKSEIRN